MDWSASGWSPRLNAPRALPAKSSLVEYSPLAIWAVVANSSPVESSCPLSREAALRALSRAVLLLSLAMPMLAAQARPYRAMVTRTTDTVKQGNLEIGLRYQGFVLGEGHSPLLEAS